MGITLGKDATVSVGGNVTGVRNVTFTATARTIEVDEYASRYAAVYSTGYDATVSMECNDDAAADSLFSSLENGDEVMVTGGEGGWSFAAVLTSISETAPVDGVVTFQIEAKMTRSGLR